MKLAILIPTYKRKGQPLYLKRALDSIFNQTHQDFIVYVIGDKYEDDKEFTEICSSYDQSKIYFENLPEAKERDRYGKGWSLWSYGGVNATNHAIRKALDDGHSWIAHLDHDDVWMPNHLEVIHKCIEETQADWMCTKCVYGGYGHYPQINGEPDSYISYLPRHAKLIHTSVCMNFRTIPFEYRDLGYINGELMNITANDLPADGDLWNRCNPYIQENGLKSYCINTVTCAHMEEGFERT
jgi:glycosyltransferase involved in cell wall biosynthesis